MIHKIIYPHMSVKLFRLFQVCYSRNINIFSFIESLGVCGGGGERDMLTIEINIHRGQKGSRGVEIINYTESI